MLEEEVQFKLPGQVNAQYKKQSQPTVPGPKEKIQEYATKAAAHVSSRSYCSSEDD
jgi:hypothetical protein